MEDWEGKKTVKEPNQFETTRKSRKTNKRTMAAKDRPETEKYNSLLPLPPPPSPNICVYNGQGSCLNVIAVECTGPLCMPCVTVLLRLPSVAAASKYLLRHAHCVCYVL